ncbi:alpha/beta hydrolase domain-containing protein [Actinomadura sp. 9N407]|uniref:alpha/beta hydrolase domain-containing protein n=1 Tax=Actinomadura sp. 9N407 TaxID=3375154 RepID=UPI0037B5352C
MRISDPLPGTPGLISTFFDLGACGYTADEYVVSGTATAFEHAGPVTQDGRWKARPAGTAPYTTRIVVYRPADAAAFDGTVVVEWLNVSSGADAPAVWLMTHRQLLRAGHAWVGISAQRDGVEGGSLFADLPGDWSSITLPPLKESDPRRYAELAHPGNRYSYDIFAQLGAALRDAGTAATLGLPTPQRIIAAGESQSAASLVTFINAVAPLNQVYDGYLVHGRPGLPLGLASGSRTESEPVPARVRTDGPAPILILQSETDVVGLLDAVGSRQPDDQRVRLWEIAGAAHADTYTLGASFTDSGRLPPDELAALLVPRADPLGIPFPAPINSGPQQHYVAQAAVEALRRWIRDGVAPPQAQRLELAEPASSDGSHPLRTDGHGNALGGVRTPWVDVPTAVLSGLVPAGAPAPAALFGSTLPLPGLAELYPAGLPDYAPLFRAAAEEAVDAGFLLRDDLAEIIATAATAFRTPG